MAAAAGDRRARLAQWSGRRRPRQPTTVLAVVVAVGAGAAAVVVGDRSPGTLQPAATVGRSVVTVAAVEREAAAIEAQPVYAQALTTGATAALAAPVTPTAVAVTDGDPDDLRISLAPAGSAGQRHYTHGDLEAGVLTRLIYVAALEQVLADRHVALSPAELADGRAEARIEAGETTSGAFVFDSLPSWYRAVLARRGADIEALTAAETGGSTVSGDEVHAAYRAQAPTDFTTVCLRSVLVGPASVPAGLAALARGGTGVRQDGCAPLTGWSPDVAAAVGHLGAVQESVPLDRGGQVALVEVTRRTTLPYSAVAPVLRAALLSRYTSLVNSIVEDQLGLDEVSVASQFGTYETLGDVHGVIPPDALTPPPVGSTPSGPAQPPRQRQDPFD